MSWPALQYHLKATDKRAFEALTRIEYIDVKTSQDKRISKRAGGFAYEYWYQGGNINEVDHLLDCFNTTLENNEEIDSSDMSMTRSKERVQQVISENAKRVAGTVIGQDLWTLTLSDRQQLLQKWKQEMDPWTVVDQTAEVHRRYLMALSRTTRNRDESYIKCLAERMFLIWGGIKQC